MAPLKTYLSLIAMGVCQGCGAFPAAHSAEPADAGFPGVAVVELFTSQGCSSCPPADRLLSELAERSQQEGQPVYCLSFHVDYWNQLGWADPYSQASSTERQRRYAAIAGSDQVYTPQMIVNGRHAFVGSERAEAQRSIQDALKTPAPSTVKLFASEMPPRGIRILYEVVNHPPKSSLQVAVVQVATSNDVPRGENAGTTSIHADVVRAFRSVSLDSSDNGELTFDLPAGVSASSCEVIAFVQNDDLSVTGANRFSLSTGATNHVEHPPQVWQKMLTREQFEIARQAGTERPFTGALLKPHGDGIYTCVCCGAPLFDSETKFDSKTGWPSFWKEGAARQVATEVDGSLGMTRTEVKCRRCDAHLGHVFDDGPQPTGLRYCINSAALSFIAVKSPRNPQH